MPLARRRPSRAATRPTGSSALAKELDLERSLGRLRRNRARGDQQLVLGPDDAARIGSLQCRAVTDVSVVPTHRRRGLLNCA